MSRSLAVGTAGAAGGGAVPSGRRARELSAEAARLHEAARALLGDHTRALEAVRTAFAPLRAERVAEELDGIPVARLKDATEGRLRITAIEAAGFATVRAVHEARRHELRQVPGVGQQTADRALAAARQIASAVEETVAVRLDVDRPDPRTDALLAALYPLVEAGPELRRAVDAAVRLDERLGVLLPAARAAGSRMRLALSGRRRREAALAAVAGAGELLAESAARGVPLLLAQATADLLRAPVSELEARVDFEVRSAEYYGLLAEVFARGPGTGAAEGSLPAEVAERVRAQPLDDRYRRVSLRGYQAFGARFALAQRRVVLGDEMGLGKTVQAVAALAHLAAEGHSRFLVVCPASVLINWTREVGARSTLRALPVHGPDRREAYEEWRAHGGVAVTTYDTLHTLPAPDGAPPGMLVVDEAHYVKNPGTRRARAVAVWTGACERVLFLTGTPMENRVGEFRALVHQLRPELLPPAGQGSGAAGAGAFRAAIAPVYLRRNQKDVLTELPALVQVDAWEEPSPADREAYRAAVAEGNFMAMRRAAYADAEHSAKLRRLRELVREAAENGLKVVVFSYFREVLATVRDALGDGVVGAVSGEVPADRRQRLVDGFAAAGGHAVLLAQIEAGGTGLNLQAASVVILCEPQLKPTLEHQAVARAHRMGQVRTVQVHRLLAADTVDDRLLRILRNKDRLFDAYARRSEVAEATPDAIDISDASLARRIVEEEQQRLAAQPV
ncbi:DEAD/DEAH box helicase [Streptomyces sp. NPDC052040]|uniref:DEAD/DEAH box helicase n=1 Tax=Streptomyces sp. NPDC052040 TaxID=3365682 RepID=UPI0037D8CA8B